jgi:hypothetical protein
MPNTPQVPSSSAGVGPNSPTTGKRFSFGGQSQDGEGQQRLIVVSNRLPVTISKDEKGEYHFKVCLPGCLEFGLGHLSAHLFWKFRNHGGIRELIDPCPLRLSKPAATFPE